MSFSKNELGANHHRNRWNGSCDFRARLHRAKALCEWERALQAAAL